MNAEKYLKKWKVTEMEKTYDREYSLYEVTITEIPTGKETQKILTSSKEKAKLNAIKYFAENYAFIISNLRKVEVTEHIIQSTDYIEYWDSIVNDHRDVELNALKLLHNAKCDNRVQNSYVIFSSNMLLKI